MRTPSPPLLHPAWELGRPDGFMGNVRVKIPVPEKLRPVDSALGKVKQSRIAVTSKALDGLYLLVADEEKKIREDPKARVTDLLKKVFGR